MLQLKNLIVSQIQAPATNQAIIILPEIFGLNSFIQQTIDKIAIKTEIPVFGLDIFASADNSVSNLNSATVVPYSNIDKAIFLKNNLTSEQFLNVLKSGLDEIQNHFPNIQDFSILGFCFGGRLAYLAGIDPRVQKIVACYGSGMNTPFWKNKSCVEALCQTRKSDSYLDVLSIFGGQDHSITQEDRNIVIDQLQEAEINYQEIVVAAGHAFLNFEREQVYNQIMANQVWPDIYDFLKYN